jgi:AraC family carnitine catabolism transcriptional activator
MGDASLLQTLVVCAGNQPTQHITRPMLSWLRRLERHGTVLGAIDTGAFTLAAAGLLDGYRVTLHWEAIPLFRERYPDIEVIEQLYLVDRNRITCAGGVAALDMMLHLIATHQGDTLAQAVANGFVHDRMRRSSEAQRRAVAPSDRATHELLRIIRMMEDNLDQPLSPSELAVACRLSVRRLERIVRRRLDDSPMRYYLKLRLQAARNLLFYSELPVNEIAGACGFSSIAVFDRAFRAQFAQSPSAYRKAYSGERLRRFRPDVSRTIGLQG